METNANLRPNKETNANVRLRAETNANLRPSMETNANLCPNMETNANLHSTDGRDTSGFELNLRTSGPIRRFAQARQLADRCIVRCTEDLMGPIIFGAYVGIGCANCDVQQIV